MTQRFFGYGKDISLTVPGDPIAHNGYGLTAQVDLADGDFLSHYPPAGLFTVQVTFANDDGFGAGALSVYLVSGGLSSGSALPQGLTDSDTESTSITDIKAFPQIGEIPYESNVARYGVFPIPGGIWQTSTNSTWSYSLGSSGPGLLSRFVSLLFLNKTNLAVTVNSAILTPIFERDRIALN